MREMCEHACDLYVWSSSVALALELSMIASIGNRKRFLSITNNVPRLHSSRSHSHN